MTPRRFRTCVALLVAALGLSHANACIEVEPRLVIEFAPGSAFIPPDQMIALINMLDHARERPGPYRVSVRGYADRSTERDAKAWDPKELALAEARARALSEVMRTVGREECVTRVAIGNIPNDAPADRKDAKGGLRLSRGLVVLEKPDTEYEPREGLRIETDCGPPARSATPAPASPQA
jgi:hypothetical protein